MKKVIENIRSQLKWKVQEQQGVSPEFRIDSNPQRKEHIIYWPAPNSKAGPPRKIELLHELIHAQLAEQVHFQFSGNYFARESSDKHIHTVAWACRAATDWFVDAKLMELVPNQERAEIEEHFNLVCRMFQVGSQQGNIFLLLSGGLIIAQAIKYLGVRVQIDGKLKHVVDAFLSTSPENPSVQTLEKLINKLLAVYTDLRVQLVIDSGLEVWEIIKK